MLGQNFVDIYNPQENTDLYFICLECGHHLIACNCDQEKEIKIISAKADEEDQQ